MRFTGYWPVEYPYRSRVAEYVPGFGWEQDNRRRRVKKPYYHFVWPKDGKRGSKFGRMVDILTGQGPDVHVTISADKMDYMNNRQRRARWAGYTNLDDRGPDVSLDRELPWLSSHETPEYKPYDFRTRRYRRPRRNMWTDVDWSMRDKVFGLPGAYRDDQGEWWQNDPSNHALDWWQVGFKNRAFDWHDGVKTW